MPKTININDVVAVKLTEEGERMLRDAVTIRRSDGSLVDSPDQFIAKCYPMQPDGTRRFQLWELMRYFGFAMFIGNTAPPIETEITLL